MGSNLLIDGHLVRAEAGAIFHNANPSTEEVIGQEADGSTVDIVRGVAGARRAFGAGGGVPAHLETGFHVEPALFVDVDNPTTSAQVEILGPVICLIAHSTFGSLGTVFGADAPFGGFKTAATGGQCGTEGLEIFTETKTVGWPA